MIINILHNIVHPFILPVVTLIKTGYMTKSLIKKRVYSKSSYCTLFGRY